MHFPDNLLMANDEDSEDKTQTKSKLDLGDELLNVTDREFEQFRARKETILSNIERMASVKFKEDDPRRQQLMKTVEHALDEEQTRYVQIRRTLKLKKIDRNNLPSIAYDSDYTMFPSSHHNASQMGAANKGAQESAADAYGDKGGGETLESKDSQLDKLQGLVFGSEN